LGHGKSGPGAGFRTYPQAHRAIVLSGELLRLEDRFGLTPSSRARLVCETPAPAAPAFEHYFQPVRIGG